MIFTIIGISVLLLMAYNEYVKTHPKTQLKDTEYTYNQSLSDSIFMSAEDKTEYLQSDKWKELKELRMMIAMDRCEVEGCNSTHNLSLHHETYERLGNEGLNDVKIICQTHHQQIHNKLGYDRLTLYPISII